MQSTPETRLEAQRALAQFLEDERQRRRTRGARASIVTRTDSPGASLASFHVEAEAQHIHESLAQREASPTQRTAEYAKARNQNPRPLRQIDETDEDARDGRDSALAYLERRRRSVIRK
jgi:predicted kinase